MFYKGIKDVKLLILDTKTEDIYVRINNDEDLIIVIKDNLNSIDFELTRNGSEIEVIQFTVINNNNSESSTDYRGTSYYDKIYHIYYKIHTKIQLN